MTPGQRCDEIIRLIDQGLAGASEIAGEPASTWVAPRWPGGARASTPRARRGD